MIIYQDCSTSDLVYLVGSYKTNELKSLPKKDIEIRLKALVELQARYGPMAHRNLTRIINEHLAKEKNISQS